VRAVSLNYRDLMVADGRYGGVMDPPIVAASDMAGVVAAVGDGAESFVVGDRVVNAPFRRWPAGGLNADWVRTFVGGNGVDGVLAEQVAYPAEALVRMPAHCSFEEGATLTIAGLTAWAAVVTHGHVRAGDWVLTHGTGGVSIFAAQIAAMMGARTILTTSSEEKAAVVRERFGVAHTLDYRDPDWPNQLRALTGGHGADVVVEVAGGETLDRSLAACAYNARLAVIGALGGGTSTITVRHLLARQIRMRGIFMESRRELDVLARAVEANQLHPCIHQVFDFAETPAAYEAFRTQRHIGKLCIRVSS
jgi:NADPH:quinone reductase-like Zn-dependent oxidoreductase